MVFSNRNTIYWMDIFSHLYVVKILMFVWKDKNKWKSGRRWKYIKKFYIIKYYNLLSLLTNGSWVIRTSGVEFFFFKKKVGQPRPLFVYFRSFQTQYYRKNFRLQRDSNSDHRSSRRARWPLDHHHGPSGVELM